MQRFQLFIIGADRTDDAPELKAQMDRAEKLPQAIGALTEAFRCTCQPNKSHRTEDGLIPEKTSNERLLFASALQECSTEGFNSETALPTYVRKLANLNEQLSKEQERFLGKVQKLCNKVKKQSVNESVRMKIAYDDFHSRRDEYDLARHRLKSCKLEEIELRGKAASKAQKAFEQKATILHGMLTNMPGIFSTMAFEFSKIESQYMAEQCKLLKRIRNPERVVQIGRDKDE